MNYQTNNLVHINQENVVRFAVRSVHIDLGRYRNKTDIKKQHAIIVLQNCQNGREVIHPLTQFIFSRWKGKAYNTQRVHAKNVTIFLNYLLTENWQKYKLASLADLNLEHGSDFLNHLTRTGKARSTVKAAERTLTEFYVYLSDNKIIGIPRDYYEIKPQFYYRNKSSISSPFKGVIYPSREMDSIAHMIPEEYILPFLEMAVKVSHPIALGVYMQCFGGIRIGGLVNISRSNITSIGVNGEYGLIVTIKKQHLRNDVLDSSGANYVKKERKQLIFPVKDWLPVLYSDHIRSYTPTDGSDSLFVNRDGKAMTGRSYRQYFTKLKGEFLKSLRESDDPKDKMWGIKLESLKWSTHIGRGIFTNLLSESAQNPYDIAIPRGDSTLAAALVYQGNTKRMKENLEKRMEEMYKDYLPNFRLR